MKITIAATLIASAAAFGVPKAADVRRNLCVGNSRVGHDHTPKTYCGLFGWHGLQACMRRVLENF